LSSAQKPKQNPVNPNCCPLCGNQNACLNLAAADINKSCWCNDPSLTFPDELRARVPENAKMKACICRECVIKFHQQKAGDKINS